MHPHIHTLTSFQHFAYIWMTLVLPPPSPPPLIIIMRIIIITCRNYIVCRSGVCLYYYLEYTNQPPHIIIDDVDDHHIGMIALVVWCAMWPGQVWFEAKWRRQKVNRKILFKDTNTHTSEIETSDHPFKTYHITSILLIFLY